ncbi:Mitochondrial import inner membrane translocase subunit Tim21 [Micractinium conductrix]|uniref:Mitochondrial import inner membrane translocase subunit Tim21 n=1 Tax=Micractinium conductrix TaxID=554055 RepID=A0A2P6V6Y2_9CHLO|nr:Mitochondrial import inner membrane translocase subunit Tim21 [Micractinium conductrix]|eukprot:PSC69846.1 Mitochondrial import inner membrane translocase subunit Tim21 [Micractinium conductrix]
MHDNDRFKAELGAPLSAGPWYNSSVLISPDGHLATVTLPVKGSRRSSDVTVRIVRRGGLRSTLLYNLVGGAEWEVLVMQAVIGMGPGGIPRSMSLLEQQVPDTAAAAGTAAAMGHGERPPAAQQAQQAAAPAAAAAAQEQPAAAAAGVRQGER